MAKTIEKITEIHRFEELLSVGGNRDRAVDIVFASNLAEIESFHLIEGVMENESALESVYNTFAQYRGPDDGVRSVIEKVKEVLEQDKKRLDYRKMCLLLDLSLRDQSLEDEDLLKVVTVNIAENFDAEGYAAVSEKIAKICSMTKNGLTRLPKEFTFSSTDYLILSAIEKGTLPELYEHLNLDQEQYGELMDYYRARYRLMQPMELKEYLASKKVQTDSIPDQDMYAYAQSLGYSLSEVEVFLIKAPGWRFLISLMSDKEQEEFINQRVYGFSHQRKISTALPRHFPLDIVNPVSYPLINSSGASKYQQVVSEAILNSFAATRKEKGLRHPNYIEEVVVS